MTGYDPSQHFWAKIGDDRESWHPLVAHSADVAAVFELLLRRTQLGQRLGLLLGRDLSGAALHRLCALAVYHDAGKAYPGFQRREDGHQAVMVQSAGELAEHLRYGQTIHQWFENDWEWTLATWGHHGEPTPDDPTGIAGKWTPSSKEKVREVAGWASGWYPKAEGDADPISGKRAQHLFIGILTLADWIASDERFFPFRSWHPWETPRDLTVPSLAREVARERAEHALEEVGLFSSSDVSTSFEDILEGDYGPYGVQSAMKKFSAEEEGSLLVLESPTGSGKTEGQYARFAQLLSKGLVDSLYFAVPTRSASKELQDRLVRIVERTFEDPPRVSLAAPGHLRIDDIEGESSGRWKVDWAEDIGAEGWASERSKLYTSSAVAVGTVDQALLAVLKNRHAHMRRAGLSRSLLVVDEVHASDAYMTELLGQVLEAHLEAGGHAVLMSATLGSAARARYTGEEEPSFEAAVGEDYPRITPLADSPDEPAEPSFEADVDKQVSIEEKGWIRRPDAIARRAESAAESGAKVLVIRNSVKQAQKTYDALDKSVSFRAGGVPVPHHSRFCAADRRVMDNRIEEVFNKSRPAEGRVCVATQTVEQSLDIDADYLITDLCPIDVLLQRIGRLHRHEHDRDRKRPPGYGEAQCLVATPSARDLTARIDEDGSAYAGPGLGTVYQDLRVIEKTWQSLRSRSAITIPEHNRRLIEEATHPTRLEEVEAIDEKWKAHGDSVRRSVRALTQRAGDNVIDFEKSYSFDEGNGSNIFPDRRIRTRTGLESIEVELPRRVTTPLGQSTKMVSLSPYLFDDPEQISFNSPVASEATQRGEEFRFQFDGKRFKYAQKGIHR
ncbi:CRISPR-associated helicase Cas3' [Salinibacter grassmerensis]|uniref:CRISPR-associated helicase Cas3' n=1 Tax=Salinibacter grassmerensis TaxID=3040353 RepID=UPI0021E8FE9E|nr:CRISPR-associated helicase Cas3' [Salinibacter grassmerensis]